MNPNDFPEVIAAHECGHVVALAAAGLADEFQKVTIVPQNGIRGLTTRSGASLTKLSGELAEYSARIASATGEAQHKAMAAFNDFIATTPDVCLPHLCFFFGGGSLDRLFKREDTGRNSIDADCIRNMVMPAMVLQAPLSDEQMLEVQGKVDEFLHSVFKVEENEPLFRKIYKTLEKRNALTRTDLKEDDLGKDIRREMDKCAKRSKEGYEELLAWFREWHGRHRLHF